MYSFDKDGMAAVVAVVDVVRGQGSVAATIKPPAPATLIHSSSDCLNGKCVFLLIYQY